MTKSLILGRGRQLLQAQYVVYYLKLLDRSQFLSPMQNFHFISPSRLSCAWACLHLTQNVLISFKEEEEEEGAISSTISRQAGKPRCWSNNFTVADVTGEPRLHLFIHLLRLCIIFSKTVSKPKSTSGDVPSYDNRCAFNCINTIMVTLSSVTHNSEETTGFGWKLKSCSFEQHDYVKSSRRIEQNKVAGN